jgi:methylmalonyl-CoA/ethylmalonyl-CoA epimerase
MDRKLAHVGIAVKSIAASVPVFTKLFPQERVAIEEVADQGVKVAFIHAGPCKLELTEATRPDSPIAKFIEKRGEGVHHLSFEVEDLQAELDRLKAAGLRLIDERPRAGAGGCLIAFVHPSSAGGILIELSQKPRAK